MKALEKRINLRKIMVLLILTGLVGVYLIETASAGCGAMCAKACGFGATSIYAGQMVDTTFFSGYDDDQITQHYIPCFPQVYDS
ncbi:MAG: hypothetical protein A7315_12390 [Candidatus Altiarchaeales archaeon WOR_SM1_79]|nr:MAG: hypothetical protein A7315_12390 [Candidatus Altiarchaeales archaeon WOR_SM1_79]